LGSLGLGVDVARTASCFFGGCGKGDYGVGPSIVRLIGIAVKFLEHGDTGMREPEELVSI